MYSVNKNRYIYFRRLKYVFLLVWAVQYSDGQLTVISTGHQTTPHHHFKTCTERRWKQKRCFRITERSRVSGECWFWSEAKLYPHSLSLSLPLKIALELSSFNPKTFKNRVSCLSKLLPSVPPLPSVCTKALFSPVSLINLHWEAVEGNDWTFLNTELYICQLFLKVQWARSYEPQTGSQKAERPESISDSSSWSQPSASCCSTHLFCLRSSRWMWLNSGRSVGSSAQQRCISWPSSGLWLWGSMVGLRQGHSPRTTRSTISAAGEEHQETWTVLTGDCLKHCSLIYSNTPCWHRINPVSAFNHMWWSSSGNEDVSHDEEKKVFGEDRN